jgi:hypothetical protein
LGVQERFGRRIAPQQSQKHRLQYVFGVGGITGNAVRRTEDEAVVFLEDPFDIAQDRGFVFLFDREFQGAPPVFSLLKTGIAAGYYKLVKLFLSVAGVGDQSHGLKKG